MLTRALVALVLALAASSAWAEFGTIDNVPAATILYPNFEVDPDDPNGVNTILTLQNTSASAAMAHVVLWTDLGLPTADFNIYLTGYDMQTIDLRTVFNRRVPISGDAGDDPMDTITPQGPLSQDINFPGINVPDVAVQGSRISRDIAAAHSGGPDPEYFGGLCGSRNFGDGIARGYVTADTVVIQFEGNPTSPGYFANLDTRNIFTGEYTIVDPANGRMFIETAVHIEAQFDALPPRSFYGRFVNFAGTDRREGLPTAWGGMVGGAGTNVAYWRDPGEIVAPFACGGAPAGLPTGQARVSVFTAGGALQSAPAGNLFPFVNGVTAGTALGLTDPLGWVFANLNLAAPDGPPGAIRQSWVTMRQAPFGGAATYSTPGVQLGNAVDNDSPIIP
jgi:hypothetical protein